MAERKRYDIDTLLDEVITLPSLPDALARINQLLSNPNCALSDVAKAISSDPSIAIKTLRLVNSAYYGLGQEITSIEHAVVLLGVKVIKNLALTATVLDKVKGSSQEFMRHCVASGVAMRVLAENGPLGKLVSSADEAFVFGLLHDVGKVIFSEYLPDEYQEVRQLVAAARMPWYLAEREIIGIDHGLIGGSLAQKWKLSRMLVNAVSGHHDLQQIDPEMHPVAATLTIADYLCHRSGMPSYPHAEFTIPEAVWTAASVDKTALPKILNAFFDALPLVEELLRVSA